MGGKRINLTHRQKARLLQEANNECPFCDISDAGVLEFHHIDGDSSHTVLDNLIALCPTCHSKIGDTITNEVVVKMKEKLQKGFKRNEEKKTPASQFQIQGGTFHNPVMGNNTTVHNNVNNSVNKSVNITVKKQVTKKVIEKYPEGSIGRDVIMYSYAKYLADRYVEYRKYDLNEPFKYQVLYGSVMKKFKVGGFFYVPQTRFLDLVVDLQGRIDRTILAKVNKSKGQLKNYSTYEAYKIEMGEKPKMIDLIS